MKFEDLTKEVQETIMSRFANWGINGKEAYENPKIFPEEFSQLEPEEMLKILEFKHISHIKSRSNHPELESDINNVILEDIKENRHRQKNNMTPEEEEASMEDFLEDIKDGDLDDDGNVDIESLLEEADNNEAILDIIGLSLPIGMIMSGVEVMGKVKNNEIVLNDAPTEFLYDTGKKSIKLAVVGTMLASGSTIIVTGTVAVILYRSRKLLESMFKGLYRGATNPKVVSAIKAGGGVIRKTGKVSGDMAIKSSKVAFKSAGYVLGTKKRRWIKNHDYLSYCQDLNQGQGQLLKITDKRDKFPYFDNISGNYNIIKITDLVCDKIDYDSDPYRQYRDNIEEYLKSGEEGEIPHGKSGFKKHIDAKDEYFNNRLDSWKEKEKHLTLSYEKLKQYLPQFAQTTTLKTEEISEFLMWVREEDFPFSTGFNENCWVIYSAEFPSRLLCIKLEEETPRYLFERYYFGLRISDLTYKGYASQYFEMNYKNLWKRNMTVRFVNKAAIAKTK